MHKELIISCLKTEVTRRNFYEFCKMYDPGFFAPDKPHLKLIADSFQKIAERKINKLMVSLPPRAGKSYITSLFCAWMLGRNPAESIMRNSYSMEIAGKFSYDVRGIICSAKYRTVFPGTELKNDRGAIGDWALTTAKQSSYFCAGVGGSITGKGCSLIAVLDDPVKNIEDALSETIIDKTWAWYTSTHLARMESGCAEIQIATRWSRRDVIGRLRDIQPAEWVEICIPALNDAGESFCEAIKTTAEYEAIRTINDSFIWSAEYMQEPVEKSGLLFELSELNRFEDALPVSYDGIAGYCDTADSGNDYLCAVIGGMKTGKIYITNVLLSREGMEITEQRLADLIIQTQCTVMTIESNAAGKIFTRNVRQILNTRGYRCELREVFNSKNKETRILMHSGIVKNTCFFKNGYNPGSDYDKFIRQLTGYVKSGRNKHDDAVDAVTGLVEMADLFTPRILPQSRYFRPKSKILKGYIS